MAHAILQGIGPVTLHKGCIRGVVTVLEVHIVLHTDLFVPVQLPDKFLPAERIKLVHRESELREGDAYGFIECILTMVEITIKVIFLSEAG